VSLATFVQVLFILAFSVNHITGISIIPFDPAVWSATLKPSSKKLHISLSLLSALNVLLDHLLIKLIISSSELSHHIGAKSSSVKSLANQGIFSKSNTTLLGLAQASFDNFINLEALSSKACFLFSNNTLAILANCCLCLAVNNSHVSAFLSICSDVILSSIPELSAAD